MRAGMHWVIDRLIDPWFPAACASCGAFGPSPCEICVGGLSPADEGPVPEGLDSLSALLRYDGGSRPFVAAVKYRGARASLATFAPALAGLVGRRSSGVVLTWAPTTDERRRRRGFDQAETIARLVSRSCRIPVGPLLRRLPGPPQTGRSRSERIDGVHFLASAPVPAEVVVCDDVVTTGATLSAAAAALRQAGGGIVHGLALTRTPSPPPVVGA